MTFGYTGSDELFGSTLCKKLFWVDALYLSLSTHILNVPEYILGLTRNLSEELLSHLVQITLRVES